jgi:ribosome-binding protein aMBF1 (putative translation factor)
MTLQTIKSIDGKDEYVLLPMSVYRALKDEIEDELAGIEATTDDDNEYIPFVLADYVDNPIALARIKAHITQTELAERMGVTQAYISKIERQKKVTPKLMERVNLVLFTEMNS